LNFWLKYRNYFFSRILSGVEYSGNNLESYRKELFAHSLFYFTHLSTLAFIPGFALAIKEAEWFIAILDLLTYGALVFTILSTGISLKKKRILFILIIYTAAIGLILLIGYKGPGILYLMAVSVWASISISNRSGIITAVFNLCIYLAFELLLLFSNVDISFLNQYEADTWGAIGINLVILNFALVFSVNHLFNKLNERIIEENRLQNKLEIDNKQLQSAIRKAEDADKLKSVFLTNMSHEIRTPMNAIVGFSDLMKNNDITIEQRTRYADIISQNSDVLLTIINDIIELSKIDSSNVTVDKTEISIKEFISNFTGTMEGICPPEIKLLYEVIIPEEKKMVHIDVVKLTQVLSNLVENAFKYSEKGNVRLNFYFRNQSYYFQVSDEGIGIPVEMQDKIFNRFYQINSEFNGVGLGLSIVSSFMNLMGGEVKLNSKPGKGSTFTLCFPEKAFQKNEK
jgi:signal transduction histidine kinase